MLRVSGGDYHKGAEISLASTRDIFINPKRRWWIVYARIDRMNRLCRPMATRLKVSNLSMNAEFNDVSIQVSYV